MPQKFPRSAVIPFANATIRQPQLSFNILIGICDWNGVPPTFQLQRSTGEHVVEPEALPAMKAARVLLLVAAAVTCWALEEEEAEGSPHALVAQIQSAARLIANLRHHFYSGCVFLLYSPEDKIFGDRHALRSAFTLVTIERILANEGVSHTVLDLTVKDLWSGIRCQQNNPLNVVISSDELSRRFLVQASRREAFEASFWLLMFGRGESALKAFLEEVELPFDAEVLVAQLRAPADFRVWEVHRVWRGAGLTRVLYGDWSGERRRARAPWPGLEMYERRFDMQGFVFRAVVKEGFGTNIVRGENNSLTVTGFIQEIWHMLELRNNFTTEYTEVGDGLAGGRDPGEGGRWTGLVGMLQRGEADVAVSMLAMTPERRDVVHFPFPLLMLKFQAYVRAPERAVGWHKVLSPFDAQLWAAVCACALAAALCLMAVAPAERRLLATALATAPAAAAPAPDAALRPHDAAFCALYAFEMQGAAYPTPSSSGGRLVLLTAYLTAVVVAASYSATLVASLAVAEVHPPFRSLQELLADGSYSAGVVMHTSQHTYFQDENRREEAKQVFARLMQPDAANFPRSEGAGVARVCARRYAFLSPAVSARAALRRANCSVLAVPIDLADAAASFALARNCTFFRFINYNLQRMANFGILSRVQRQALFERREDAAPAFVPVTAQDAAPMLAALGAGGAAALALLLLERLAAFLEARRAARSVGSARRATAPTAPPSPAPSLPGDLRSLNAAQSGLAVAT